MHYGLCVFLLLFYHIYQGKTGTLINTDDSQAKAMIKLEKNKEEER
jgi:hypothetical protein